MVICLCVSYVLEGFVLDQFPCGCCDLYCSWIHRGMLMLMWTMHFYSQSRGLWRILVASNWIGIYWSLDRLCVGFGVDLEIESFMFWRSAILAILGSTTLCCCWKSLMWFAINISNLEGKQCSRLLLSTKLAKNKNSPDPFILWVMSQRLYYSAILYSGVVNFLVMLGFTEGCW